MAISRFVRSMVAASVVLAFNTGSASALRIPLISSLPRIGSRPASFAAQRFRQSRLFSGLATPLQKERLLQAARYFSSVDSTREGGLGFIDTHCHLDAILPRLARQSRQAANAAKKAGQKPPRIMNNSFQEWRASLPSEEADFEGCVNIGCSAATLDAAAAFLSHTGVYGAFGIHPLFARDWNKDIEQKLVSMMSQTGVVAWGECGLDYFDKKTRGQTKNLQLIELQRNVFARQLDLAVSLSMPIVVHTREAEEDTLELLTEHVPESHLVHVHCFTGSLSFAKRLLERFPRLHLGFTGVVTFKAAREIQDVVRWVPLERLLLETDGPYMAPEPFRGTVAHPGHVAYIARAVADLKGLKLDEVLRVCRENTRRVYGI